MAQVRALDAPFCCAAKFLADFGEESDAQGGDSGTMEDDAMRDKVLAQIETYKGYGFAFLCVILTDNQKTARRVLFNMGWKYSNWMKQAKHDHDLRLYWYPLHEK